MDRPFHEIIFYDQVTPVAVTSSTDAAPAVVTATSHGLSVGQLVLVQGHTTNTTINGIWQVATVPSANTFTLQDPYTKAVVNGAGAGNGSGGIVMPAPNIGLVPDFRHLVLEISTSGSANFTAKLAGSLGKLPDSQATVDNNMPNMGATQSPTNPYSFIQAISLDTATPTNGSTGITTAGTDLNTTYEANINGLKYFTILLTAWSAGAISIKGMFYANK